MLPDFNLTTVIVRCMPDGREVTVLHETSLMDSVIQAGLPLGRSCDGVALCGFCRVLVIDGAANLTPMAAEEERLLAALRARPDERLACCARVQGPVTITTTYW